MGYEGWCCYQESNLRFNLTKVAGYHFPIAASELNSTLSQNGGSCWDRTNGLLFVREALYH